MQNIDKFNTHANIHIYTYTLFIDKYVDGTLGTEKKKLNLLDKSEGQDLGKEIFALKL